MSWNSIAVRKYERNIAKHLNHLGIEQVNEELLFNDKTAKTMTDPGIGSPNNRLVPYLKLARSSVTPPGIYLLNSLSLYDQQTWLDDDNILVSYWGCGKMMISKSGLEYSMTNCAKFNFFSVSPTTNLRKLLTLTVYW